MKTTYAVTIDSLANGEHTFAVSFRLADGNGGSNSATFTINYTPPNRAPVAVDDVAQTYENTSVTFNVLTNDSDPDGDPIDVIAYIQPANGAVSSTGNSGLLIYTPNTGFTGTDSFTYTIRETGGLLQDSATVTITVISDPYPDSRVACEGQPPAGTFTLDDPGTLPGDNALGMHLPGWCNK